jgi:hypothetical protein
VTTAVTAEQVLDGIERAFAACAVSTAVFAAPQDGQPADADRTKIRTFSALPRSLSRATGSGGACRRELEYEVAITYHRTRDIRAVMLADAQVYEDLVRHMARELMALATSPLATGSVSHPQLTDRVRFLHDQAVAEVRVVGSIEYHVGVT